MRKLLPLILLAASGPALAHGVGGHAFGFAEGFAHPLLGWDHLLAMVAVGAWAVQQGGRALWLLPGAFVGGMALGEAAGFAAGEVPRVDPIVLATVVTLLWLVVLGRRVNLPAGISLIGGFGVIHGFVHGFEIPETVHPLAFAGGTLAASALLHAVGIGGAVAIRRLARLRPHA
jgi:urease accessory protein